MPCAPAHPSPCLCSCAQAPASGDPQRSLRARPQPSPLAGGSALRARPRTEGASQGCSPCLPIALPQTCVGTNWDVEASAAELVHSSTCKRPQTDPTQCASGAPAHWRTCSRPDSHKSVGGFCLAQWGFPSRAQARVQPVSVCCHRPDGGSRRMPPPPLALVCLSPSRVSFGPAGALGADWDGIRKEVGAWVSCPPSLSSPTPTPAPLAPVGGQRAPQRRC